MSELTYDADRKHRLVIVGYCQTPLPHGVTITDFLCGLPEGHDGRPHRIVIEWGITEDTEAD